MSSLVSTTQKGQHVYQKTQQSTWRNSCSNNDVCCIYLTNPAVWLSFPASNAKQYWHTAVISLAFRLCHKRLKVAARKRNALNSLTWRAHGQNALSSASASHVNAPLLWAAPKASGSGMQTELSTRKGKDWSKLLVPPPCPQGSQPSSTTPQMWPRNSF